MISLRLYQQDAVDGVRAAFRAGFRAPLLVAPTGAGKTVMFSHIAHAAMERGSKVLIVAHRKELIRQASRKLSESSVPHGVIAPWSEPTGHQVQVASVQTLGRRIATLPRFDLIILDEAHHAVAGTWAKVIASQPQAKVLGVTATPERLDGRGLGVSAGGVFDELVMGPTIDSLIEGKFLTPSRVFAPSLPDLSSVGKQAGDYDTGDLSRVMSEPKIVGDVVAHYGRLAPGLPAIAFCPRVSDAQLYAEAFRDAGWRSIAAYGAMPADERDRALSGLASGDVQILTTCDLVSEGLDVPCVGAVILLRSTKSLGLHVQQVGRGLRPMPGKSHLIVLDHAGNTLKHGLPDTAHTWSLDGKKARDPNMAIATWRCGHCFAMNAGKARVCGECQGPRDLDQDEKEDSEAKIEEAPGELVEVDHAELNRWREMSFKQALRTAQTDADLREVARARGYKPGWVHKIKAERAARRGAVA